MKINSYKILVLLVAIGTMVGGCKKSFLDVAPTDAVPAEKGITTMTEATGLLNGIHRTLYARYNAQGEGGQGAMMINLDMLGEDLVNAALGNNWYINTSRWVDHRNVNSALVLFAYQFYYQVIANANTLINSIDAIPGSTAEKQSIKAQALSYRAWAYFYLVQLYGKRYDAATQNTQLGVPLVLTNTIEGQPRATVEEVYTQINKDLDDAIAAFATAAARPNKSNLNINVAKGIKARVALTQQKWAQAAQLANEARSGFALMSAAQLLEGFNNISNPEWIWGSDVIDEHTIGFAGFFGYMSSNFNSTNIRTNPKLINNLLYNQMSATDRRRQWWDPTGNDIPASLLAPGGLRRPFMTRKFLAASQSNSVGDVPLMRSAEMILIEAEAKARAGDEPGARTALFTLMSNRDPNYTLSTNSGQALINEILLHRRIELWGEGFRFLDLKRLNEPLNRNGGNHTASVSLIYDVPAGDKLWEFLLPQNEINSNKAAVQNPL